jgi:hypothetical protein
LGLKITRQKLAFVVTAPSGEIDNLMNGFSPVTITLLASNPVVIDHLQPWSLTTFD